MLSPRKVIRRLAASAVFAFLPGTVLGASPFPGKTIPDECFVSGNPVAGLAADPDDGIHADDGFDEDVLSPLGHVTDLPPEGEQYTRVITNAKRAWEFTEGNPRITVAIVDSGIDTNHSDLVENLWVNEAELHGRPGVDDDGNGFVDDVHGWDFVLDRPASIDISGHGTHCAGNVAAARNGFGVIGVAPRVKVMAVRFMKNGSGKTVDAIKALVYAAQNGAQVLSNSWSSSKKNECIRLAIAYAQSRGALVVTSANNQKRDIDRKPSYPASFPDVIAVGSSNAQDQRSKGSNWGKAGVMLFAPGEKSLSTDAEGTYSEKTGTSMAAPQVAGALALGISLRPDLSHERILQTLCRTGAPALRDLSRCGRMDLGAFLDHLARE